VGLLSGEQEKKAVEVLRGGGVVAFPTDTVYGLGASAKLESALKRIYQIKHRPFNLALPLLLADLSDIEKVAASVPRIGWQLAECFLPGGLTLVLYKAAWISPLITAGGDTVAVRVPDHPVPRALARGLGVPIVGTSANRTGQPSPLTVKEVRRQLGNEVDFIIEGDCPGGIESTMVDVTRDPPVLLREGAISQQEIESACGLKLMRQAQKGKS
jgi:L-threonylcarbamoyladenylate synthase